ncbi:MAG: hypothetical protein ACU841_09580 [Gammaproteobacteria bacterium]
MADRRSADPVDQMVRLVFARMRVKYPLYWARRTSSPEKLNSEREKWRSELSGMSPDQVADGLRHMRRFYHWRPPFAGEFRRLVINRSRRPVNRFTGQHVEPVVDTEKAKEFFETARKLLR